jgi:hypothetical protein
MLTFLLAAAVRGDLPDVYYVRVDNGSLINTGVVTTQWVMFE